MRIAICDLYLMNYWKYRALGRPSKYAALITGHFYSRPNLKATIEILSDLEKIPSYDQIFVINDRPNLKYNHQLFNKNCFFVGDYWPKSLQYYSKNWEDVEPSLEPYQIFLDEYYRKHKDLKHNIYDFKPFLIKRKGVYHTPVGDSVIVLDDNIGSDAHMLKVLQESEVKYMALAYPIVLDLDNGEAVEEFLKFASIFPLKDNNQVFIKSSSINSLKDLDNFFFQYNKRKMPGIESKLIFYYYCELKQYDLEKWLMELKKFLLTRDYTLRYCDIALVFKAEYPESSMNENFINVFERWDNSYAKYSFIEFLYMQTCGGIVPNPRLLEALLSGIGNYENIKNNSNRYLRALNFFYNFFYNKDQDLVRLMYTCSYLGGGLRLE